MIHPGIQQPIRSPLSDFTEQNRAKNFSQKIIDYLKRITMIRSMSISFRYNTFAALLFITPFPLFCTNLCKVFVYV